MREKHSFAGAIRRADGPSPLRYLPFPVPAGARRIELSYHYEYDEGEKGYVDLGLFDARGADFLTGGFRGWSGSARSGFFVATGDATPGYIPGPLPPGEWNVMLGWPVRGPEVARYWVELNVDSDPNAPDPDPAPAVAQPRAPTGGRGWYRGDFHSHTVHSDGYNSIDEYVVEAKRVGLGFLAITDHNTSSHFVEIARRGDDGLLLIPGEEVTTGWGHANVWGAGGWVDFRCDDDAGMQRIVDSVHERGGLFSPNHPKASAGYPWEFEHVRGYRVAETWQGPWRFHNAESLDFWEQRLRAGDQVVAVGGSDCHSIPPAVHLHPWTLGDPCTWVYADNLSEQAVLDAVRAGHVFISEDPTGPFLEATATCAGRSYLMGDTIAAPAGTPVEVRLRYRGPSGKKLRLLRDGELWRETIADGEDLELAFELPLDAPGYLRAEAAGFRGRPERGEVVHALCNPFYLAPEG